MKSVNQQLQSLIFHSTKGDRGQILNIWILDIWRLACWKNKQLKIVSMLSRRLRDRGAGNLNARKDSESCEQ